MTFWSCRKSGLIRKIKLVSTFMTSWPGKQTIAIQILPNISQSKGNQKTKFDKTERNMKNIFFEKSYAKCSRETTSRPFSIKSKLVISLDLKFYTVYFYCMASWGLLKYIETKLQTTCFYLRQSFFKKQK